MLDRIIPVHRSDLISLYYAMYAIGASAPTKINATAPGEFAISAAGLCVEPVKKATVTATSGAILFVPAFDFEGFFDSSGNKLTFAGAEVEPDGKTLYSCTITGSGTLTYTIAKITL